MGDVNFVHDFHNIPPGSKATLKYTSSNLRNLLITIKAQGKPDQDLIAIDDDVPEGPGTPIHPIIVEGEPNVVFIGRTKTLGEVSPGYTVASASIHVELEVTNSGDVVQSYSKSWQIQGPPVGAPSADFGIDIQLRLKKN